MPLKSDERVSDGGNATELSGRISDGFVFQLKQMSELRLIQFANTFGDVLGQDEIQEGL